MARAIVLGLMLSTGVTGAEPPAAGGSAVQGAVVSGVVSLDRRPTTSPPVPRYENIPPSRVGPPEPPVAVVYLEGVFPSAPTSEGSLKASLPQQHLQFLQGLMPIQVGTAVEFPNQDPWFHNVFSYSRTKRFDLGRYAAGESPPPQVFDRPGVVRLNCEIHPHMRATLLVLETPHFVRTDTNGSYRLSGLPAGRYTLRAWVEEKDVRSATVELRAGAELQVNFPPP